MNPATGVELVDGVDEAEHAVADQIGLLDVLRQPDPDSAGHVLHQRRVLHDELVADRPVLTFLVLLPELCDRVAIHR